MTSSSVDEKEQTLNDDVFSFINKLAGQRKIQMQEEFLLSEYKKFEVNIKSLSIYHSFYNGLKQNDYATVLHRVVALFSFCNDKRGHFQRNVFECLLKKFHKLITSNRAASDHFSGQTPLHMAICKGKSYEVRSLIEAAKESKVRLGKLFSKRATGKEFKNTAMMGELPLSIAALTGNYEIIELLLEYNINVCQQNSQQDNLCHSLLKYAHIYPEKVDDTFAMIKFIVENIYNPMQEKSERRIRKLFSMTNKDQETPLVLAAKFGMVEIFEYILDKAYHYPDNARCGGLFDVKLYDMTEIDYQLKVITSKHEATEKQADNDVSDDPSSNDECEPSIFDFFFDLPYKSALRFMKIRPIKWMIARKWKYYRWYLYIWWFIHTVIMSVLTASAVKRVTSASEAATINKGLGSEFPAISSAVHIAVALFYVWMGGFFTVIIQICKGRFRKSYRPFLNPYANASFKVLFSLFALCLLFDFPLTWVETYENYLLLTAIVIGWYISLFFMRAHRHFCFFTSLIQRALVHDLAQFAPIIFLQLLAFSTAMFMLLQGAKTDGGEDYGNWWKMLFITFQSFLGLAEIQLFTAKQSVLISIVYAIFITMTTILMLTALIAVLTTTCDELIKAFPKEMHLNLQRLSIILFFEELLPSSITCKVAVKITKKVNVFGYDRKLDEHRMIDRYMIRIDTLNDEESNEEKPAIIKRLEEMIHSGSVAHKGNEKRIIESTDGYVSKVSATKSKFVDNTINTTTSVPNVQVLEVYNYNRT
ncbi:hypothetical protein CHS0354_016505 [Potamilus streckersoni]|uniref:Uncharacterized protein n=1 Tax=Potamilus streckersoni TaxID=2493646 RepID=A0AAE0SIU8_9BIVA|nr:hypothetical protein CHS0354_016505 [Potamilus streckersoni]